MARTSSRRWAVLAVGVVAQACARARVYGVPFLLPLLRDRYGLSLAAAATLVSTPVLGLLLTLVAWGALADHLGERRVLAGGLAAAGATGLLVPALQPSSPLALGALLALAGACAGSVNAASGRLILGWFPRERRGLAMGIRQTAQPLGVALAAATLPTLAHRHGLLAALGWTGAWCLAAAVLVLVVAVDPHRDPGAAGAGGGSPYGSPVLWRVTGASALLVLPQFAVSAFAVEYLVRQQQWSLASAGALVAVLQVAGALGRIGSGVWSDRVGSRLGPMRQLAVASAAVMLLLGLGAAVAPWLAVVALGLASLVTVADNGLAFVATAELAGAKWAGRALGVQNTGQNVVAFAGPPALGAVIGWLGYGLGFALVALAPAVAVLVTPVGRERASVSAPPARP
jgi:sugar phosphate permease